MKAPSELSRLSGSRSSTTAREVRACFKLRGRPLESLGISYTLGLTLTVVTGLSVTGHPKQFECASQVKPNIALDGRAMSVAQAWIHGVFAVKAISLPSFVKAHLQKERGGWYTVKPYISLRAQRYLVSLDVRRKAMFLTAWSSSFKRMVKRPTIEFFNLVESFRKTPAQPQVVPPAPVLDLELRTLRNQGTQDNLAVLDGRGIILTEEELLLYGDGNFSEDSGSDGDGEAYGAYASRNHLGD